MTEIKFTPKYLLPKYVFSQGLVKQTEKKVAHGIFKGNKTSQ